MRKGRSASLEPGALLAWSKEGRSAGLEYPLLAWGTALPCWLGGYSAGLGQPGREGGTGKDGTKAKTQNEVTIRTTKRS